MGATAFVTRKVKADNPEKAFSNAIYEAIDYLEDLSWLGESGTVADKQEYGFVIIPLKEGCDPHDYARKLIEEDDRIQRTGDPAGCFEVTKGEYMFFGWAG